MKNQHQIGYLLNTTKYEANLVYANDTTPVVEISITGIVDEEPTGTIRAYKVSENGDKIGGTEFEIYADEKITNKAGTKTYYTKGQKVATIVTANGTGIAEKTGLPLGKYKLVESRAVTGYLLNTEEFKVELKYVNDTTPVVTIEVKGIVNKEPTGTITISKKDEKTGTIAQGDATLKGAVYRVYADEDIYNVARTKKYYSKGDLVATRTTNERGECEPITDLPLGKYIRKRRGSTNRLLDR